MKKYKLKGEAIAIDEDIWLGIDVHKKTLHVTAMNDEEVLCQRSVPSNEKHVRGFINKFRNCEIVAVYESGPTGYWLKHWLEKLGCEAFITPVSKVPEIKGGKQIKTDRRDSRELAKLARAEMLEEVHDLGEKRYRQRELTRTRKQFVKKRTQVCNQIKSKLLFHGIEPPDDLDGNWSKAYLAWLESEPSGDFGLDLALEELVDEYRRLTKKIRRFKKEIKRLSETEEFEKDVDLLTSVPGVGVLTAMTFLLELGDISRFDRCEEFASFLGLIPGEWSSGERQQDTKIRWGNKRVRTALVESSWRLKAKDPQMEKTYERILSNTNDSGKAIVAVARRLGLAMRAMLREGNEYDYPGPAQNEP